MQRLPFAAFLLSAVPALAEPPAVVADTPVTLSLVAQVMEGAGAPALLLDQGANPHDFQMRPSQAQALQEAGLIFWIGPELTPWLERALEGAAPRGKAVALLEAEGTELRDFGADGGHGHEHAHEHEHEEHAHEEEHGHDDHAAEDHHHGEEEDHDHDHAQDEDHAHEEHAHDDHGHDGHVHTGRDPHAWLDPSNAALWLGVIAEELAAADPENAALYAANAVAAQERVAALDAELAAALVPAQGKPFVVFHDAYGYFAAHYGLTVAGSVALGDSAAPGAERLAALRGTVRDAGALCLFPEARHDPKLIGTLAEGSEVRIGAPLDPEGRDLEPGAGLYEAVMRGLGAAIAECLADT